MLCNKIYGLVYRGNNKCSWNLLNSKLGTSQKQVNKINWWFRIGKDCSRLHVRSNVQLTSLLICLTLLSWSCIVHLHKMLSAQSQRYYGPSNELKNSCRQIASSYGPCLAVRSRKANIRTLVLVRAKKNLQLKNSTQVFSMYKYICYNLNLVLCILFL